MKPDLFQLPYFTISVYSTLTPNGTYTVVDEYHSEKEAIQAVDRAHRDYVSKEKQGIISHIEYMETCVRNIEGVLLKTRLVFK